MNIRIQSLVIKLMMLVPLTIGSCVLLSYDGGVERRAVAIEFTQVDQLKLNMFQSASELDWENVVPLAQKLRNISIESNNQEDKSLASQMLSSSFAMLFFESTSNGRFRESHSYAMNCLLHLAKARDLDSLNTILSFFSRVSVKINKLDKYNEFVNTLAIQPELSADEKRLVKVLGRFHLATANGDREEVIQVGKDLIQTSRELSYYAVSTQALTTVSHAYNLQKEYNVAIEYLEEARKDLQKDLLRDKSRESERISFGVNTVERESTIDALIGSTFLKSGDWNKSYNYYLKAQNREIGIYNGDVKSQARDSDSVAIRMISVSDLLISGHQYEAAMEKLEEAQDFVEKRYDKNLKSVYLALINRNKAVIYHQKSDSNLTKIHFDLSIELMNSYRSNFSPFLKEISSLGISWDTEDVSPLQLEISDLSQQSLITSYQFENALVAAELGKSRNLLDLITYRVTPKSLPEKKRNRGASGFLNFVGGLLNILSGTQLAKNNGGTELWKTGAQVAKGGAIVSQTVSTVNNVMRNYTNPKLMPIYWKDAAIVPTLSEIQSVARTQKSTIVEYSILSSNLQLKEEEEEKILMIWVIKPSGEVISRKVDLQEIKKNQLRKGLKPSSISDLVPQVRANLKLRSSSQDKLTFSIGDRVRFKDDVNLSLQPYEIVGVNEKTQTLLVKNPSYSSKLPPEKRRFSEVSSKTQSDLQLLYQLLIEPIKDALPQDSSEKVIFIPHKELFLVPFVALQDKSGKFLIEKHTISTAPSIQTLSLTHQRKQNLTNQTGSSLIIGNPYPNIIGELNYAESEASSIAQITNGQLLTREAATKKEVIKRLSDSKLLHFATHGILDEQRGFGSSIVLTRDGEDDGLLRAEEIADMKLNAELVVLSACDTGRGKLSGDGVIGLSRSFITAGVPSVIVSLWKVPDQSTAPLMTQFYQNLKVNPDKAVALREAMLTTMKQYPDPVNWAAFTLIGES